MRFVCPYWLAYFVSLWILYINTIQPLIWHFTENSCWWKVPIRSVTTLITTLKAIILSCLYKKKSNASASFKLKKGDYTLHGFFFHEFYTTVKLTPVVSQHFDHKIRLYETETIHIDQKYQRQLLKLNTVVCLEPSISLLETRNQFWPSVCCYWCCSLVLKI